jgi:hypothetical protein
MGTLDILINVLMYIRNLYMLRFTKLDEVLFADLTLGPEILFSCIGQ